MSWCSSVDIPDLTLADTAAIDNSQMMHIRSLANMNNTHPNARRLLTKYRHRNSDKWRDMPENERPSPPDDGEYRSAPEDTDIPDFVRLLQVDISGGPQPNEISRKLYLDNQIRDFGDLFKSVITDIDVTESYLTPANNIHVVYEAEEFEYVIKHMKTLISLKTLMIIQIHHL